MQREHQEHHEMGLPFVSLQVGKKLMTIIYYYYSCCFFPTRFPYRSLLYYACIYCSHLWHWSGPFWFDVERMRVFSSLYCMYWRCILLANGSKPRKSNCCHQIWLCSVTRVNLNTFEPFCPVNLCGLLLMFYLRGILCVFCLPL